MEHSTAGTRPRLASVAAGLTVVALAAGCSGNDPGSASDTAAKTPSAAASTPTASSSPSSGADVLGVPVDTSDRSSDDRGASGRPATLERVRVGRHPTYDRVVIDFAGGDAVPDYTVAWLDADENLRAPGSGKAVPLESNRILQVRLRRTRNGESRGLEPRLPAVREVRAFPGFEAETLIGIGVQTFPDSAEVVGFRVRTLPTGPARLVVDVAHADAYARAGP